MEKKTMVCPYCGGIEFVDAIANRVEAGVRNPDLLLRATQLCYTVCLSCGTVARTYVQDVEQLRPKKEKERSEEGDLERKVKDFFLMREPEEIEGGREEVAQKDRLKPRNTKDPWKKRGKDPWE